MNRLFAESRVQVVAPLVEGASINAICRMTGVAPHLKPFEDLRWAVAFCRVHKTLRVTPAMRAGISNHVWSMEGLISLLDVRELANAA
jgi:hypothetical protein